MFNPFKSKKKEDGAVEEPAPEGEEQEKPVVKEEVSTPADLTKIAVEIDRLKAGVESFGEVRKSFSERFTRMSEQIGELRAMILDRDRTIREIELKAIKAADLVETVQPEKFMVELQKEKAKFEALKANIEGNEAMMERMIDEVKEMRRKLEFFKGIEEIIKLSEEVKLELIEMKKVQANVNINNEKIQTMYSEIRKKYQSIDIFNESLQELKVSGEQNSKEVESIKTKIITLVERDEMDKMINALRQSLANMKATQKTTALTKDVAELKSLLDALQK